jgi:proliferating cell nuclear antigen
MSSSSSSSVSVDV